MSYTGDKRRQYQNAWHKNNRARSNAHKAKYREKLRQEINSIKASGCIRCGEKDVRCLVFHHLNDKDKTVSELFTSGQGRKLREEIKKCVVLCCNCHAKEHIKAPLV